MVQRKPASSKNYSPKQLGLTQLVQGKTTTNISQALSSPTRTSDSPKSALERGYRCLWKKVKRSNKIHSSNKGHGHPIQNGINTKGWTNIVPRGSEYTQQTAASPSSVEPQLQINTKKEPFVSRGQPPKGKEICQTDGDSTNEH